MSKKRMFSMQIVDSDAFLEMPQTSQLLYFHLSMRADDDGFIDNHKKIMKIIGSHDDDLKVLISKRFIIAFESGVLVIKHWLIHNTLRKDRYSCTTHIEEKALLTIKQNKVYTENGNQMATGLPQYSIVENSIDKYSDKPKKQKKQKPVRDNGNQLINYGSQMDVLLTENEYNKLIAEYGKNVTMHYINRMTTYSKAYTYDNHNLAIRSWMNKDNVQKLPKQTDIKKAFERHYPTDDEHRDLLDQGLTNDQIMAKYNPGVEKFW